VDQAFNGQEALDIIAQDVQKYPPPPPNLGPYDPLLVPSSYTLILMDCNMPFMDGFESSQRIRQLFKDKMGVSPTQ